MDKMSESKVNQDYKNLKDSLTKVLEDYREKTGETVYEVSVEIDEEGEYAQICPIIGQPEYTQEAKEILENKRNE